MNLGQVIVTDQARTLPGGMPGGAASQLTFLEQQNVAATFFRQMVKKRHAHNAATDYDNPLLVFHDDYGEKDRMSPMIA